MTHEREDPIEDRRKYGYVWEKFYSAVRGLAASEFPLPRRLANAYLYHLMHLRREELPEDIKDDFRDLVEALSRKEATGDEGNVMASATTLDELEVNELIHSITDMYDRVAKHGPNG